MIHRQQEMNNPNRTDYYLMSIRALLIGQSAFFMKKTPELDKMRLEFRPLDPVKTTMKELSIAEQSKRLWIGYLGGEENVRTIKAPKAEGGSDKWTDT